MDNVSSVFLLVCLLVSLLGNITQLQQQSIGSGGENNNINISSRYTKPNNQQRRRPKLGDGCRHVFLDVGSNIGVHGRILFEPHLYPIRNSTNAFTQTENVVTFSARTFFKEQLGPEDERVNTTFVSLALNQIRDMFKDKRSWKKFTISWDGDIILFMPA